MASASSFDIEIEKGKDDKEDQLRSEKVSEDSNTPSQSAIQQELPRWKWILTCSGLLLGALLYGLDTTIAADVQASVYAQFHDIEKLPWVGIGFPLGSVAVILLYGQLFANFKIKWLLIGSFALFEAGSALCGAAPSSDALIVGRVVAGAGGAGMYIGALNYISVFTSLRRRSVYTALIGFFWGIGAILGPVVSGAFSTSSATWRWSFYINLPLAGFLTPLYVFIFPQFNPKPSVSFMKKLREIDWVGAVLNTLTFTFFIVVLSLQGTIWSWTSGGAIALWVLFGVSFISFILQQTFCIFTDVERRLFPVEFTARRTLMLMFLTTAAASGAVSVTLYYVPIFFQFSKGDSALEAAVRLLPFIIVYVFTIMFAGGLLPLVSRYAPLYFPSSVLIIVGGVMMFRVTTHTSTAAIYGYEVLIAIGSGLIFQTGYPVAQAKVPPEKAAASIGFINVSQIGSIAIALSIGGQIYQNLGYVKVRDALAGFNFTEAELRSTLAGAESVVFRKGDLAAQLLAVDAVVDTISFLYPLVIAAGGVVFVCACFMRWEKLKLDPVA